jgi:hypothetical protein
MQLERRRHADSSGLVLDVFARQTLKRQWRRVHRIGNGGANVDLVGLTADDRQHVLAHQVGI